MFKVEAAVVEDGKTQVFEAGAGTDDECMAFIEKNVLQSADYATCYYRIVEVCHG